MIFSSVQRLVALGPALAGAGLAVAPSPAAAGIVSEGKVDHSAYDVLLKSYVDQSGMVDYQRWKQDDAAALKRYLDDLAAVDPDQLSNRNQKLAYWINLYNALTIDAVLHFYPIQSIKDKVSVLFGYNVWDDYKITVGGRQLSLNDIEHKILRKLGEPRIHFAIVCASKSCPRLRREAYSGDRLDQQLTRSSRDFFAAPDHLRVERQSRIVYLSPILDWFGEDFGVTDAKKLDFVASFAPEELRDVLRQQGLEIKYLDYDWSLNQEEKTGTGSESP